MNKPICVLIVEDSEDDAFFLLREIRLGGYDLSHRRVDTPEPLSRRWLTIPGTSS